MRRFVMFVVAIEFIGYSADPAGAQFSNSGVPGAQQGDVHVPWSPKYLPLLPNQPIQYGSSTSFYAGNGGVSFYYGGGWPGGGYGWGRPYPYWPPYPYYPGPVVLPPVYLPAEELYGPLAVKRFMGIDGPPLASPPVIIANKAIADRAIVDMAAKNAAPGRPKVRISNAAMKAQAGKFMAFGDANFAKQKYNSALERYRSAAQVASDVPETFLRQGFAQVAMSNYESAAKVMRRALLLEPNPNKWNLRLDDLYVDNKIAKTAHLEALAQAVEENAHSADLLLLLGLQLYFDGQAERAMPVFQRSKQLGGNDDGALNGLLQNADRPKARLAKEI